MDQICCLLPGADEPIQTTGYNYEDDEFAEEEIEEIFGETTNTNGDNIVRTLPQPSGDMAPLSVEVDPVSIC